MSAPLRRDQRDETSSDVSTALRASAASLLERVASAYRRRSAARAALVAIAGGSAAAAAVLLWDAGPGIGSGLRPLAATLPVAAFIFLAAGGLTAALRPRPRSALTRLIEERAGLAERFSTALEARLQGPVGTAFAADAAPRLASVRVDDVAPWRIRRPALAALLAATSLAVAVLIAGGPAGIAERWTASSPARAGGADAGRGVAGGDPGQRPVIEEVRWSAHLPDYAGGGIRDGRAPDPVRALVGSRIAVRAEVRGRGRLSARLLGGDPLPDGAFPAGRARSASATPLPDAEESGDPGEIVWRLRPADRALELALTTDAGVVDRRILPLAPVPDAPPRVELEAPARDMILGEGRGVLEVRATARDDHGLAAFEIRWIRSRGSGESYAFDEGVLPWAQTDGAAGARRGRARLDLASLELGPGDVLHLRAFARDANPAGVGEGVSETRTVRIAREDEEALVDAVLTLPIEAEENPILSQRMLILLTERLLASRPAPEAFRAEATRIAEEQARLRGRVGEVIFSRTGDGSEGAPPDPFGPPVDVFGGDPGADEHGHEEGFDPLDPEDVLAAASRATGTGDEDEIAHRHDESAILSINQDLLDAYNAMWEAERELRQAAARASLPHQNRALDLLQEIRAGERVFSRARVTVPPVDVAGARGSGELDGVRPQGRGRAASRQTATNPAAAIEDALGRWDGLAPAEAALVAADVAAALFADPRVDARAGALVVRAADRARGGDVVAGKRALAEALRVISPPTSVGGVAAPPAGAAGAFYDALAPPPRRDGGTGAAAGGSPGRFVFATARYTSGDWDSAPLVPTNLTHSVAQYTSIPVAPEPVIVDLGSREVFRYPFLFLTGHLPVHFTAAERDNVRAYVERGGLLFIDDHNHDIDAAFHRSIVGEIERIFGAGALVDLPSDHELYRAFFVFPDGPPTTTHELNGWGDGLIHETLKAVLVGGRIGVLYSNKDYASQWNYHAQNKRFNAIDDTRFGVNVIVYALTR